MGDPLEVCLAHFGYDFDDGSVICKVNALLDSTPLLDTNKWKSKLEPLVLSESRLVSSVEDAPTLTHKPLSSEFFRLDDIGNETVLDDNGSISRDIITPLRPCLESAFEPTYVCVPDIAEFEPISVVEVISADLEPDLGSTKTVQFFKQSLLIIYEPDLLHIQGSNYVLNKIEFSFISLGTNISYCRFMFMTNHISWVDPQLFRIYIYDSQLTLGYQLHNV